MSEEFIKSCIGRRCRFHAGWMFGGPRDGTLYSFFAGILVLIEEEEGPWIGVRAGDLTELVPL